MKKTIQLFLLLLGSITAIANTAQPGIRSAGGTGGFTLLFPEDSAAYKKVQMQKELVSIQLYPGFAVVKGEYWMYNSTKDLISMKTGYPINAQYSTRQNSSNLAEIIFDKMFKLSVSIDGHSVNPQPIDFEVDDPKIFSFAYNEPSKWYIWTTEFKPESATKIEVYFIVNTNDSNIKLGYSSESFNGFIYVLETGASWKPPIGSGSIRVQLKDGLTVEDIKGVSPESIFTHFKSQDFLSYNFKDLIPTHEDNIVITYSERLEDFDFENIISKSETYFKTIDAFSKLTTDKKTGASIAFDSPFEISTLGMDLFLLLMFALPVLGMSAIVFTIFKIMKRRSRG